MNSGGGLSLSRFFAWWFGELRACLPRAVSNALFGSSERLEVSLANGEADFVLQRNDKARPLGQVSLDQKTGKALGKAVRKLLRRAGVKAKHVTLRLPAAQALRPVIELPVAAAENLREVLAFEMDRHTPFSADDVLFDFQVSASDADLERLSINLLVAQKDDVSQARKLAETMRLSPDRIAGPARNGSDTETFNLIPEAERPRPARLMPRLVGLMSIVTLVLAGVTFGLWFDHKQKTLELYETRVAELRASTGVTGRQEEKVANLLTVSSFLVEEKRRRPQMIEILDEITRRLPDQHWLISYSYRDGSVQLGGYSNDPSSVLRLLEQSVLFSEARFSAPVTLDPRIGKERFNLIATVVDQDVSQ